MSSVLDDINKRRTRQSVGEQAAPVEPVAPVAQPMGDQASARAGVAPQPQVVQPQVQEPANRPVGDQASARVAQGAMPQAESGFNPTAEQKATAGLLMNPALTTPAQPAAPKQMTYTDLHKELYKPMTPEEKAAQQKRQRNRQIINAVGDGISALANLYYTNRSGVNAYDPSTSLTKAAKERYDKLLAQQREDEERYKELAYRSGAADIEMAYRRAKDAAAEKRADKAADDAAEARRLAQENWQKTFEYGKEKDAADRQERAAARAEENKTKTYIADLNARIRKELFVDKSKANAVKTATGLYGKRTVHGVDGYPIYDKVWNGGWPEVFNTLVINKAGIKENESEPTYRRRIGKMSDEEKQELVNGYYKYYPEAVALMARMAADTPERYVDNIIADEDDYSQYAVGGDDYSQYIIE